MHGDREEEGRRRDELPDLRTPSFRRLCASKSSVEILRVFCDDDPLGIEERAEDLLREQALFLEPERFVLRSMARVAYAAPGYRGRPPLAEWLDGLLRLAITDLLTADREEERERVPTAPPYDVRVAYLTETLGIEPAEVRPACIRFNDLPLGVRRTFFAIVVDGVHRHRWIAEGNGPPARVQEELRQAFRALSARMDPPPFDLGPEEPR